MLKVLIATDGSPTSEQAIDLALELLSGKQAEVTVLHVIPRHLIYGPRAPMVAESYDMAEAETHSKVLLNTTAQRLREGGVGPTITEELDTGDPAEIILAAAEQDHMDMIIIGSRGLGAVSRFWLGSVSTKVTSHAHCAVLVAHPKQSHGA